MTKIADKIKNILDGHLGTKLTKDTIELMKSNIEHALINIGCPASDVKVTMDPLDPTKVNITYTPYIPMQVSNFIIDYPISHLSEDNAITHDWSKDTGHNEYFTCNKCQMKMYPGEYVDENLSCDEHIAKDIIK